MKLSKVTILVIIIFVIDAALAGVYYQLFGVVRAKNERIATIEDNIKTIADKDANLKSIKGLVVDTEESRAAINTFVIPQNGEVDFLEDIERLARQTSVDLSIVTVEERDEVLETSSSLDSLHLHLEARGTWPAVFQFLRLMELLPLRSVVGDTQVEFLAAEKKSDAKWRVSMKIGVLKIQ